MGVKHGAGLCRALNKRRAHTSGLWPKCHVPPEPFLENEQLLAASQPSGRVPHGWAVTASAQPTRLVDWHPCYKYKWIILLLGNISN